MRRERAGFVGRAVARVSRHGPSLLLAATAAGLAYVLAGLVLGPRQPFFAPIAAVVCVGITGGQRIRRAVEIVLGVAVGLLTADLIAHVIEPAVVALSVAVLVATVLAVSLGAGNLMSNQAAVAAVLVVALSPGQASPFLRLIDALIGGSVALGLNAVFSPDPTRRVRRAAEQAVSDLCASLEQVADALTRGDLAAAEAALSSVQRVVRDAGELDQVMRAARESARLTRRRRHVAERLVPLEALRARLDLIVGTTQGLARGAANAVRHGRAVPEDVITAVRGLAGALGALESWLDGSASPEIARRRALEAARMASTVLDSRHGLTVSVLVGHLRSATIDLLRATGLSQAAAVAALEEAAGRADRY